MKSKKKKKKKKQVKQKKTRVPPTHWHLTVNREKGREEKECEGEKRKVNELKRVENIVG